MQLLGSFNPQRYCNENRDEAFSKNQATRQRLSSKTSCNQSDQPYRTNERGEMMAN